MSRWIVTGRRRIETRNTRADVIYINIYLYAYRHIYNMPCGCCKHMLLLRRQTLWRLLLYTLCKCGYHRCHCRCHSSLIFLFLFFTFYCCHYFHSWLFVTFIATACHFQLKFSQQHKSLASADGDNCTRHTSPSSAAPPHAALVVTPIHDAVEQHGWKYQPLWIPSRHTPLTHRCWLLTLSSRNCHIASYKGSKLLMTAVTERRPKRNH